MITEIPINESHVFAFRVTGKLEAKDYDIFRPRLEALFEKESPLSILVVLEDFEGWSAKAAWEDMKIGFEHHEDFLRIAVVGDRLWEKLMVGFGDLFTDTEVRYFENESKALNWIKNIQNHAEQDDYIGYRHILVATDFSRYADTALRKGLELAKPFAAKVSLIHVAEILSNEIYPSMGELAVPVMISNPELEKKQLKEVNHQLEKLLDEMNIEAGSINTVAVLGHPVDAIIDFAKEHDNDLIVMGSHGRRGLARLLGSSTNGVVNHAPCDVLTVIDH